MTSRDFCYWLQGYFEIRRKGPPMSMNELTHDQCAMIERHLALVFKHEIDPSQGTPELQAVLQKIHDGKLTELDASKPHHSGIGGIGPDGTVYRC